MIKQLKIYNVGEKIRIGNTYDGGYVLPKQSIDQSECLFSYGINNDITFDEHYIKLTNRSVYGYDHTIDNVATNYPYLFTLYNKGLSGTAQEETDNFLVHYEQLGIKGRVLLKVDVEGCEYDWLENTNIEQLAKITTGLVLEVHFIDQNDIRQKFINCLEKLNKHFYLCHIHGNNYGHVFNYQGHNVPMVLELTFIPKDIVNNVTDSVESFPTELDAPNNPYFEELKLDFV